MFIIMLLLACNCRKNSDKSKWEFMHCIIIKESVNYRKIDVLYIFTLIFFSSLKED